MIMFAIRYAELMKTEVQKVETCIKQKQERVCMYSVCGDSNVLHVDYLCVYIMYMMLYIYDEPCAQTKQVHTYVHSTVSVNISKRVQMFFFFYFPSFHKFFSVCIIT